MQLPQSHIVCGANASKKKLNIEHRTRNIEPQKLKYFDIRYFLFEILRFSLINERPQR